MGDPFYGFTWKSLDYTQFKIQAFFCSSQYIFRLFYFWKCILYRLKLSTSLGFNFLNKRKFMPVIFVQDLKRYF